MGLLWVWIAAASMKIPFFIFMLITAPTALCETNALTSASEEQKTPPEWLAVVEAETTACKQYEAEHPEEAKLLLGACWMDYPNEVANFPAKYQEAYAYYVNWSKNDGEAAFKKWRHDGFPILTDPRHLILHVEAMKRRKEGKDLEDYTSRIVQRGKALLLKGCSGERLSRGELDELRLYALYQCHNYESELLLPGLLGWMPSGVAPGTPAPDFTLPLMEEILERPTYSDRDPNDIMNQYRPQILTEILQIMNGYEATTDKQPGSLVRAKPYDTAFKNPVTLSSLRGKPVLFLCADATDTWCWCGTVAPMLEPLYCFIRNRVAVFLVHTTVHDFMMWGGSPWAGNPVPLTWAFHPLTLETRARTAKMFYMAHPVVSIPYLLDDNAYHLENAYESDGGGARTYLVDKGGTVSFTYMNTHGESDNYVEQSEYGNEAGPWPPDQRQMNLIECNLKALLDAGGVWNKEMKTVIPDWKVSPELLNVPLTAVDSQAGTVTVTDKKNKPVVIAFDSQTRIMQNGKRMTSADLKPNQTVQIMYQPDAGQSCGQMARIVVIGGQGNDLWVPSGGQSWLPAEVQAIDLKQRLVTVKMTLAVDACKGPGLWKTATPALLDNYRGDEATEALDHINSHSVPDAFKAVAAIQDKPLLLHVDRFTEFFLNGMTAHLADLRVGDKIGFDLADGFKPDDVWPHFVRVYRF